MGDKISSWKDLFAPEQIHGLAQWEEFSRLHPGRECRLADRAIPALDQVFTCLQNYPFSYSLQIRFLSFWFQHSPPPSVRDQKSQGQEHAPTSRFKHSECPSRETGTVSLVPPGLLEFLHFFNENFALTAWTTALLNRARYYRWKGCSCLWDSSISKK